MTLEIGSIAELITAIVAVVGVIVTVGEYKRSNRIKRSSYIEPLIDKLKSDDISQVVYTLQYGKFDYNEDFHGSKEEIMVDRTLQYLSYLCYLRGEKIISKKEFSFFELEISQSLRDSKLIDYLYNLYHFVCKVEKYDPQNEGIEKTVYSSLLKFAKKKHLIDNSFFDNNAYKEFGMFHRYLNF